MKINFLVNLKRFFWGLTAVLTITLFNSLYASPHSAITSIDQINIQPVSEVVTAPLQLAAKAKTNCKKLKGVERTQCFQTQNWGRLLEIRSKAEADLDPKGPKPKGWCKEADHYPVCCNLECDNVCPPGECDEDCGICLSSKTCTHWDCNDNTKHGFNCTDCTPGGVPGLDPSTTLGCQ
jgi:hypothetical protein